jgi:hypothetical protein
MNRSRQLARVSPAILLGISLETLNGADFAPSLGRIGGA